VAPRAAESVALTTFAARSEDPRCKTFPTFASACWWILAAEAKEKPRQWGRGFWRSAPKSG
jgi:hypothetical protein